MLKVFHTQLLCLWRWYYFFSALLMDYTQESLAADVIHKWETQNWLQRERERTAWLIRQQDNWMETHNWLSRERERTAAFIGTAAFGARPINEQDRWIEEHLTGHLAPPSSGIPFPTSSQINWPAPGPGRLVSVPAALHTIRLHNLEVTRQYMEAKRRHLQHRLLRKTIRTSYRKWKRRCFYC